MTVRLQPLWSALAVLMLATAPFGPAAAQDTDAEKRALRAQLERMKTDTQALDARLRELEARGDTPAAPPVSTAATQAPQAPQATAQPATAASPTPAPASTYTPSGPALRQAADPAPYEAAVDTRIAMFRLAFSLYRWIPVGSRQLVVFNTYDQAYLLDFASDCPGLLSASRIRIENFSTHVKAGEHAVVADGQRCLISYIFELRISKLPKALRP